MEGIRLSPTTFVAEGPGQDPQEESLHDHGGIHVAAPAVVSPAASPVLRLSPAPSSNAEAALAESGGQGNPIPPRPRVLEASGLEAERRRRKDRGLSEAWRILKFRAEFSSISPDLEDYMDLV